MKVNVRETISGLVRKKKNMKDLGEDDNYFELGVSSLSIIELQISVEEELGIALPTSQLMRLSTIRGWIDAYSAAVAERARRGETESGTTALAGELR